MTHDQQLIYDYVYKHGRITTTEATAVLVHIKSYTKIVETIVGLIDDGILAKKDHCYILAPKRKEKIDQPKMF